MEETAILGIVLGIFAIVLIPLLIVSIITLVANFKIYQKAGEEGWKCLIPYYNTWTECNFTGINTNWIWIILAVPIVSGILEGIIEVGIFNLAAGLILFYFQVLRAVSLSQSFGKDTGFAIGIFLLPFIFCPILAFGKAEYVGPKPMKDFIFKNNNSTSTNNNQQTYPTYNQPVPQKEEDELLEIAPQNNNNQTPAATENKFCTNCGAKIEEGTNFCTSCGTKLN